MRLTLPMPIAAVAITASLILSPGPSALSEDSVGALPRYRFAPGQELVYQLTFEDEVRRPADGEEIRPVQKQKNEHEWRVYVVRRNEDGSFRLVIRKSEKDTRYMADDYSPSWEERARRMLSGKPVREAGEAYTAFSNVFFGYCDMHPDGRYESNRSLGDNSSFEIQPEELFCQLPPDKASFESGWKYRTPASGAKFELRSTSLKDGEWQLCGRRVESQDAVYLVIRDLCYRFDDDSGVIDRITDDWQVKVGRYRRRATVELTSVVTHNAAWMEEIAAEACTHIEAVGQWNELLERANVARTLQDCMTALGQGRRALAESRDKAATPEVLEAYDAALALHDRDVDYAIEIALNRQLLYSKPPIDWETTAFDGKPHRSADYRGKVVIMDFWYRGCGHCIKAMPKIQRLAAKYEEQAVRVLSMSIDRKAEDAQFVIDTLGIEYPVLRSHELVGSFGVRGFPTFVVLDQSGRVALRVSGNSETLEKTISDVVDDLLADPPK